MALVVCARQTTSLVAGTAIEIIPPPGKTLLIKSVQVFMSTASASGLMSLGIPAAKGVTPTTPQALVNLNGGGAALSTSALAWGTSPTIPNKTFNRFSLPATVGTRYSFDYPGRGLSLTQGQTWVLFNIGVVGILDVAVTISEF